MEGTFKKRLAVVGAGLGLLTSPALLVSGFAYEHHGAASIMQIAAKAKKKPKQPAQEVFEIAAKGKKKEKKPMQEHLAKASVMQLAKGKKTPKKPQTPPPSSPSM